MAELSASQVDRLGDRLRENVTPEDLALLREYRRSYRQSLETVVAEVRDVAAATLGATQTPFIGIRAEKATRSIIAKLARDTTRLSRMQDIAGCRVVVHLLPDQDALVAALVARRPEWRVVDRRADPRHGYRAVHLITPPPRCVEVQVRTVVQDSWAGVSEAADREREGVKYGEGPSELVATLQAWSVRLAELEASGQITRELLRDRQGFARLLTSILGQP